GMALPRQCVYLKINDHLPCDVCGGIGVNEFRALIVLQKWSNKTGRIKKIYTGFAKGRFRRKEETDELTELL
ncbi:MAG: hypothetical protein ACI3V4_02085, partial [Faecousia sp.]